jgi:hypothetical protein
LISVCRISISLAIRRTMSFLVTDTTPSLCYNFIPVTGYAHRHPV